MRSSRRRSDPGFGEGRLPAMSGRWTELSELTCTRRRDDANRVGYTGCADAAAQQSTIDTQTMPGFIRAVVYAALCAATALARVAYADGPIRTTEKRFSLTADLPTLAESGPGPDRAW